MQTLASTEDAAIRAALMRGMLTGLEGRRNVPAPDGWAALSEKLSKSKDERVRELSSQLSQIFGDLAATRRALAIMSDASMNAGARRNALYTLLSQQNADASNLLETLLDEDELAIDAIRGYAIVENATAPAIMLHRYKTLSPELRRVVVETLATRKSYAERLIEAVEQKIIQREEIPTHVARSLNSLAGQRFIDVFGEMRPVAEDREKLIAKYKALLTPSAINSADASRGRAVFKKTCAACHTLYGNGGKIGPDLTGSNRANLDYILLNSVDPSYDVPAGYKMLSITTVAGRVVNGVLAEEDDARVVLKTVEQPRLVIVKTDIDDRVVSSKSMMPEGQLQAMKPQDVIDLIKYLRTTGQVEIAK